MEAESNILGWILQWFFNLVLLGSLALLGFVAWRRSVLAANLARLCQQVAEGHPPNFIIGDNGPYQSAAFALEQMERKRRDMEHRLNVKDAGLSKICDLMAEGVVLISPDLRVILCNGVARSMFQLASDVIGQTVMEAFRSHELQALIMEALSKGQVLQRELTLYQDFEGIQPGRIFTLNVAPVLNEADARLAIAVIIRDMSEIRRLESVQRDFVANTSHELRTPLTIFQGYLETLLDSDTPSWEEEVRPVLATLKRHSNRLNLLVNDLLTLSRLDSVDDVLKPRAVDIRALLEQMVQDYQKREDLKQRNILLQADPTLPTLWLDQLRIEQVFYNLLDNSISYSQADATIELHAHLNAQDKVVDFSVKDNGSGIPPADLPRIFERFYRVEKGRSRERGGTGLGLSIVKQIIDAHGGKVSASSQLGKGTCICFSLPIGEENPSTLSPHDKAAVPAENSTASSPQKLSKISQRLITRPRSTQRTRS